MKPRTIPSIPPHRRSAPARSLHPKLRLGIQLYNNGRFREAAEILEKVAVDSEKNQIPNAYHIYLFAARAFSVDQDAKSATMLVEKAFGLLTRDKRWSELYGMYKHIRKEYIDRDQLAIVQTIQRYIKDYHIELSNSPKLNNIEPTYQLPTHCPSCGVTIYPSGIDYINKHTVLCNICNSTFRTD